jgi:hypothetical protein
LSNLCCIWSLKFYCFVFSRSISHLYGQAGGRKNYSAHSCTSILARSASPREQLVCPFAEADETDLRSLIKADLQTEADLKSFVLTDIANEAACERIVSLRLEPQKACAALLDLKCDGSFDGKVIVKPSHSFNFSFNTKR